MLCEQLNLELKKLSGDVGLVVKFLGRSEVFEFNPKKQFWAASVIKVPIALAVYKHCNDKNIDLKHKISIKKENFVLGSGVTKLLEPAHEYSYNELITLMLTLSDNSATNELIDLIGWESVEKYMREIGLENTTFKHKMMIKEGRGPNLTTAEDMASLLEKMSNRELVGAEKILEIMKEQVDRSRIPLYLPNDIQISHKFGTLPEALHEIGIVYSPNNPFIFCFLSDDQKNKRETNEVLSQCARLCYEYSIS